jgi:hypothetical protein
MPGGSLPDDGERWARALYARSVGELFRVAALQQGAVTVEDFRRDKWFFWTIEKHRRHPGPRK